MNQLLEGKCRERVERPADALKTETTQQTGRRREQLNGAKILAALGLRCASPEHEKCNQLHFSLPGSAHLAAR